jgi:hypothetical protein
VLAAAFRFVGLATFTCPLRYKAFDLISISHSQRSSRQAAWTSLRALTAWFQVNNNETRELPDGSGNDTLQSWQPACKNQTIEGVASQQQ